MLIMSRYQIGLVPAEKVTDTNVRGMNARFCFTARIDPDKASKSFRLF